MLAVGTQPQHHSRLLAPSAQHVTLIYKELQKYHTTGHCLSYAIKYVKR